MHAASASPDGPFEYVSTVIEPFAHEPNAVRAPDGSWVVYATVRHVHLCRDSNRGRLGTNVVFD